LVNVSTLEADGIEAATTGKGIALTSLMSTVALIALFGTGFVATAGRQVSQLAFRAGRLTLCRAGRILTGDPAGHAGGKPSARSRPS
jgi:hypothetical protein